MPCFTLFNGSCLLALTILAIVLNMVPLIVNSYDGRLFQNPVSCYEWWLPGVFGGGILMLPHLLSISQNVLFLFASLWFHPHSFFRHEVIPTVSMTLAARKGQNCNTRTGLLLSALLSLISVLGALYCALVSLHSLIKGPLVCDTENHSLEDCSLSIGDITSLLNLKVDLKWFLKDECGINQTGFHAVPVAPSEPLGANSSTAPNNKFIVFSLKAASVAPTLETDVNFQKTVHMVTFSGLFLIGVLEMIVSVMQIMVGVCGCVRGISRRRRSRAV